MLRTYKTTKPHINLSGLVPKLNARYVKSQKLYKKKILAIRYYIYYFIWVIERLIQILSLNNEWVESFYKSMECWFYSIKLFIWFLY